MKIGEYNELRILRDSPHGLYLEDDEGEVVLLPNSQVPNKFEFGDDLNVFVYTDSEDRPVATLQAPKGVVGDFVKLRVISATRNGAFLDWGLDKDLFCPMREQSPPLRDGEMALVRIYLDELTNRVTCSARLSRFLETDARDSDLRVGDKVEALIAVRARGLVVAILIGTLKASIFPDEWTGRMEVGETREAYVKAIREEDGRVALSFRPQGYKAVLAEGNQILAALRENGGFLPLSDRSSPEEIQARFGLSKGAFKRLIGNMYRRGEIVLQEDGIRLAKR